MQSQPLPLHEKSNKQSTSFEDSNKLNAKNRRISDGCKSPDVEESNKFSFNVTYVPTSSVTMDTETIINLDNKQQNNVLSWDKKAGNIK